MHRSQKDLSYDKNTEFKPISSFPSSVLKVSLVPVRLHQYLASPQSYG